MSKIYYSTVATVNKPTDVAGTVYNKQAIMDIIERLKSRVDRGSVVGEVAIHGLVTEHAKNTRGYMERFLFVSVEYLVVMINRIELDGDDFKVKATLGGKYGKIIENYMEREELEPVFGLRVIHNNILKGVIAGAVSVIGIDLVAFRNKDGSIHLPAKEYMIGLLDGVDAGHDAGTALANTMNLVGEFAGETAAADVMKRVEKHVKDGMIPVQVLKEFVEATVTIGFVTGASVMFQHERSTMKHIDQMKGYVTKKFKA